jgi:hypothetical protein
MVGDRWRKTDPWLSLAVFNAVFNHFDLMARFSIRSFSSLDLFNLEEGLLSTRLLLLCLKRKKKAPQVTLVRLRLRLFNHELSEFLCQLFESESRLQPSTASNFSPVTIV